jgi:hypothetical protein
MHRKITKQKNGGHTMYLPAQWINDNSLSEKDEIFILIEGEKLEVLPTERAYQKKIEINLKVISFSDIRSVVASAYKAGYDTISLKSKKIISMSMLNKIAMSLTGLEVVSQTKHSAMLRVYTKSNKKEINSLIIKMFQMLLMMVEQITPEMTQKDLSEIRQFAEINLPKIRDFCLRGIQIHTFSGDKAYEYYDLVGQLEKVGHEIKYIAIICMQQKIKDSTLLTKTNELLEKLYKVYLKKELVDAAQLRDYIIHFESKKTRDITQLSQLLAQENPLLVVHYHSLTKRFVQISSRLLAISI